jgi:hypothetical protein
MGTDPIMGNGFFVQSDLDYFKESGANAVLLKPFNIGACMRATWPEGQGSRGVGTIRRT